MPVLTADKTIRPEEPMPTNTIRPPIKWYGGKHYLAERIVRVLPPHRIYVYPFGGAASVLLNKEPAEVEVYNDLHGDLVNMFRVLRDESSELIQKLRLTPYSREEFGYCADLEVSDPVERARRFYVQCRQSFAGRGESWSATTRRSRRGMADVVSGWWSSIDENLPLVIERLRRVRQVRRVQVKREQRNGSGNIQ